MASVVGGQPAAHRLPLGQNSLQGALFTHQPLASGTESATASGSRASAVPAPTIDLEGAPGSGKSYLDEEMQRQLHDYNRSVTIIIWHTAEKEPIRLQHMNSTFPYFQLLQLSSVIADLGLIPTSYLDAYDPRSGTWEQHTIATVRIVATQQRLLYKMRRSLLQGLSETECIGIQDELRMQLKGPSTPDQQNAKQGLKRSAPEPIPVGSPTKVHIRDGSSTERSKSPTPAAAKPRGPVVHFKPPLPPQQLRPPSPPSSSPSTASSTARPSRLIPPQEDKPPVLAISSPPHPAASPPPRIAPIPHHPHPPLKRWPNDYTVSELTAGFHAMEALVHQGQNGVAMTQRSAFERVFGSRYVKSTVCRHRGVWRKAEGSALRTQFEAMGTDERACWGEFVRRMEGRGNVNVTGANEGAGTSTSSASTSQKSTGMYQTRTAQRRGEGDKAPAGPAMASLQNPSDKG